MAAKHQGVAIVTHQVIFPITVLQLKLDDDNGQLKLDDDSGTSMIYII